MFSKALFAGLIGFAAAYTKPVGPEPIGNAFIQPGLNSIVVAGEPFTITWKPTTEGPVTLVLLKGPSENAVPQYAIVEGTPNNGSYSWTPSTDLAPTENAQGYGIQLVVEGTGQYQYTTQFGLSNPNYKKGGDNAPTYGTSSSSAEKAKGYETKTAPVHTKPAPYATGSAYAPHPTGGVYPTKNVTMVAPSGYKPTSSIETSARTTAPSATFEGPAQQTGAASNVAISFFGLVAAAGAAVLAI